MISRYLNNLDKLVFKASGEFDIPTVKRQSVNLDIEYKIIPFNELKTSASFDAVHFFIDDYQFERFWNQPDKYLNQLKTCIFCLTPDFSLFKDYPLAIQIFNHYKKQWLGAYLQANGIVTIPTVSWSTDESFSWCFSGVEKGSIVAVSSVGSVLFEEDKKLFLKGFNQMIKIIEPKKILFYGSIPEELSIFQKWIIPFESRIIEMRSRCIDNGR